MSGENVERIRAGFEAHNRGDIDAMAALYHPDVVLETLLLGTRHGRDALREIVAENRRTLAGYDIQPVELLDVGDKVVAVTQAVGSGETSQVAVDDRFAFVFTLEDGLIVREQAFRNRDEALEAAGLSGLPDPEA